MSMLMRFDPFREALSLRRAMDQLFEQSFINPGALWGSSQKNFALMNVYETDQGYQVNVAMPGVKPEDIEIMVQNNILTIRGSYNDLASNQPTSSSNQSTSTDTSSGQPQNQSTSQSQQGNWLMQEMNSGSFERTVTFARPIDVDRIQTNYEHGVLTITLPVSESSRLRRISVSPGQNQSQQIAANSANAANAEQSQQGTTTGQMQQG